MSDYTYEDREGDRLLIRPVETSEDTYIVTNNGIGVWLTAAEAPKAAQALLDAAGVKGVLLTDLPEVTKGQLGVYEADGFTSYHQSGLSWLEKEVKALVAIWLRHKADKEAEGAKLTQQIKEAVDFRANQARIEAENKAAAVKKAHDDLRTSPIALKALAIYDRACIGCGPYESWDATLDGDGVGEWTVRHFIRLAEKEEAKEKEAAEKLAARRDQLVRNHALGLDAYCYDDLDVNGKYLVDRLRIALDEGKDAK